MEVPGPGQAPKLAVQWTTRAQGGAACSDASPLPSPPHRAAAVATQCKSPRLHFPRSPYAVCASSPRYPRSCDSRACVTPRRLAALIARSACLPACPRLVKDRYCHVTPLPPFSNGLGFWYFWRTGHTQGTRITGEKRSRPLQADTTLPPTHASQHPKPSSISTGGTGSSASPPTDSSEIKPETARSSCLEIKYSLV